MVLGGPTRPPDMSSLLKGPGTRHGPKNNQRTPYPRTQISYAAAAAAASAVASSYEQISEESKAKRNGIIAKLIPIPGEPISQRAALSQPEWYELLFDHVEMNPQDFAGIDFFLVSKGIVEILMKENVDVKKYLTTTKNVEFKGYKLELSETLKDETKVVLFNVPLLIPDEEIFNLVETYGGVMKERRVYRELVGGKNGFITKKGKKIKIDGTTRYLFATFPPNKFLRRYYWLEGPGRNDPGRRITIQHRGQKERACGHCLEWASGCPALANTTLCRENFPNKRKPLAQYMKEIAEQDGYESLKTKYCGYLDLEDQETQGRDIHDHQVYDFEDLVGDEEIMEGEGFQEKLQAVAATAKEKSTPSVIPTPVAKIGKDLLKTNNTNESPESHPKGEEENLVKMLAEKEKELKLLKEENNKALSEFARLKTENNTLKRNQANDKKNNTKYIREHLQNSLGWNTSKDHTSTMAFNIIDHSQFVYDKVNDKMMVKEGADPWTSFKKTIDLVNTDKATEDRYKDLQKLILGRLKDKFSDRKTRSESKTRNRSDSSQEGMQQAKKVKETEAEKELKKNPNQEKEQQGELEKEQLAKLKEEQQARQEKEQKAKQEKEQQAKQKEEQQAKQEKEQQAEKEEEQQAKQEKELQAKKEEEQQAKQEKEKEQQAKQTKEAETRKEQNENPDQEKEQQRKREKEEEIKKKTNQEKEEEEVKGKKKGEEKKEDAAAKKLDPKVKNKSSPGGRSKKNKNNGF